MKAGHQQSEMETGLQGCGCQEGFPSIQEHRGTRELGGKKMEAGAVAGVVGEEGSGGTCSAGVGCLG